MHRKIAVTGHRPKGLNKVMKYRNVNDDKYVEYISLMQSTVMQYATNGYDYFISGGAIGVDLDFARAVIDTKFLLNKLNKTKIELEMALPCTDQDKKWNAEDKARYQKILLRADKITLVSDKYSFDCMQKRNEYMVDNCDKLLAFWNGEQSGGTWNTIQYAKKVGKDIEIIDLQKL